ncbi:TetR/AcrR family transcriptional regulator [Paenibacillus pini]|uniref:HTH tetR-type domain-containing protein n=1 Tax=Paenibacillus pini JCM 16418 TaxID=1236976 RepID=W7YKE4_9BACL|nr:TetR/AcrR family transcriptional regulator [Paenibacillus pini]GAF08158.1 hypothetical protein JCM16418_2198 [Paenibacillus pini JCM 16418]
MNYTLFPLRELKKAKTKIALFQASMSLIGDQMFRDVMLDDICRQAEVSRVTFFKFFPKKEDLLVYTMRVLLTQWIIDIEERSLRGFEGVRYILGQVAEMSRANHGLMPSLIAFLAEMNMHPKMPELSQAEVHLLFEGHEEQGARTPDMFEVFRKCMSEAEQDGQLKPGVSVLDAVQFLFTVFYGAFLTSRIYAAADVFPVYEDHLKRIEKQQSKEEFSDE